MPQVNVSVTARQIDAKISIIDIVGDVSAAAEGALMDAYTQASTPHTQVIILSFAQVTYMNSSGIGLIVTLLIRVNRQKQQMLCYGLSEHYQHIFKLTRLSDAIQTHATEDEALIAARKL